MVSERDQGDKGHASTGGVGSAEDRKAPSWGIPTSESMFSRDRRPKKRTVEMEPLPGAASTVGGSAAGTESRGDTGGTAGDRVRPMSSAERGRAKHKLAVQYSDEQATSALDPAMLEENLMFGSPEIVVEKLKQYQSIGVDAFIYYASLGLDMERQKRSLRLFIDQVLPAFAEVKEFAHAD